MRDDSRKGGTRERNEEFLEKEHAKKRGMPLWHLPSYHQAPAPTPRISGYGHGVGQRSGSLRVSGKPGAHRIGKR